MDRRTIIAFILIGLVVIFWDDYYKWMYPDAYQKREEVRHKVEEQKSADREGIAGSQALEVVGDAVNQELMLSEDLANVVVQDYPERIITVQTKDFIAKISTDGAKLISYSLRPSQRYLRRDLELLPQNGTEHLGVEFWTYDGPLNVNDLSYTLEGYDERDGDIFINLEDRKSTTLTFAANIKDRGVLRVVYQFEPSGYVFGYNVEGRGLEGLWVRDYAEVFWRNGLRYTERDSTQDHYYSMAYVGYTGNVLEEKKIHKNRSEKTGAVSGTVLFGSVRTKYFTAALIPEVGRGTAAWMETVRLEHYRGKAHPNLLGVGIWSDINQGGLAAPFKVYIGPMDDKIFNQFDANLKKTMTWGAGIGFIDGIIKPISKAILWGLKGLYSVIPNYGWCLIIFSLLIKVIIWPLTRKSYQSMAAMQKLQPMMKELREKYAKDPQKLNAELMNLYKTEKVNPMGGCFPILLQMPLLYALFVVFRSTIEFRRAPFFGWITDLSMPDVLFNLPFSIPLYGDHVAVLPLLMGITMFFQSKMTMTDPNQKMLLYIMPFFLTMIFNQFPSGLTLYYTLFNVWTLIQQKITPPPNVKAAIEARGKK